MTAFGAIPILIFDAIDSTNEEARRRAIGPDPAPAWIAAKSQLAGRGRRGRSWQSPAGNLYATLLFSWPSGPQAALAGFAFALGALDAIDRLLGAPRALLKWPNDVLIAGEKVAGILLETSSEAAARPDGRASDLWIAGGIGLNLAHAPEPSFGAWPACALNAHAEREICFEEALEAVRRGVEHWLHRLEERGFGPLQAAWSARAFGLGAPVRADRAGQWIEGRALGLGADGAFEIETQAGVVERIHAGEIAFSTLRPAVG